jgi:glucose/arabinose dehydrogenase
LFVSALVGEQLRRLEIKDRTVTHQEVIFNQLGRIHDVITGPDGLLYIACQNPTSSVGITMSASTPGQIVRLLPVVAAAKK